MSLSRLREVARFRPSLERVLDSVVDNEPVLDAAQRLLNLLDEAYDVQKVMNQGIEYDGKTKIAVLQSALRYQKRRRTTLESELISERNPARGGLVQLLWFVRIGMANPTVPGRTLQSLLSNIPEQECVGVSHCYIGRVRGAFCELLKLLQVAEISRQVNGSWLLSSR